MSSGVYVCPSNCLQIGRTFWQKNHYVKLVEVCRSAMVSVLTSSQQPSGQFWGVPQGSILIPPVFQAKVGICFFPTQAKLFPSRLIHHNLNTADLALLRPQHGEQSYCTHS